MSGRYSLVV